MASHSQLRLDLKVTRKDMHKKLSTRYMAIFALAVETAN